MVAIKAVAHFSIPVSDVPKSRQFYTEVVGCRHLSTTPNGQMVFLDAAGTCLILVKRDPPINPVPDNHGGVHHAFAIAHDGYTAALDHLRVHGVQITFEEDGKAACSTVPARIFTIPTAPYWSLST
jgi:catechol 2,3-dioxygenase-like lactoylglutathione lyase family enzyme